MQCDYFDVGACRSCTLIEQAYADQLAGKQRDVSRAVAPHLSPGPDAGWLPPVASAESGFRNKAKLVVAGTKGAPTLGILDPAGTGVDLRHCGLYEPGLDRGVAILADLVAAAGLTPYDVPHRQGELKHLLLTHSPAGELMLRAVLRSPGQRTRVLELLDALAHAPGMPPVRVASINLQPEHKAVLEGEVEELLTADRTLPMRLNDVTLHLGTRSFFQTNTAVAAQLYRQVGEWVEQIAPSTVWDLYCGVGGFALHCDAPGREVTGIEISEEAVRSARRSGQELAAHQSPTGGGRLRFDAADATDYALGASPGAHPDLVILNPPRRGIGPELSRWLETSRVEHLVYSSCDVASLAKDLAAMPSWRPVQARLFDMFPQTRHHEVAVLLERRALCHDG